MSKLFGKENKVILIKTHHILSDGGNDEGPHMAHEVAEG